MNNTVSANTNLLKNKPSWQTVMINDVCEIDPSKRELNGIDKNMEISFGMMADLPEHKRYFSPVETRKISDVTKGGYSYFRENDVLLAKMTPCFENGKSGIALNLKNGIGFGSTEFYVLRSNGKVIADWIYFIISSDKFIEEGKLSLVGTTGRRRLLKHYIESFEIPLPPLSEQVQIAALFQSIETAIEQADQQEKNLKFLQKSLSNGLAGKKPVFGNLLDKKNCKPVNFGGIADCIELHDKEKKDVSRFIGLENIEPKDFRITWGNIKDGTTFTKRFSKGDVLFGKRRAYLKKVAVADFDGICSSDILVFRSKTGIILPELLPYYASSDTFINHAVSTSAGSLSPRTKWRDLSCFELSIPDLKIQEKIAAVFNQFSESLTLIRTQKQTLKILKQKLLNEILG